MLLLATFWPHFIRQEGERPADIVNLPVATEATNHCRLFEMLSLMSGYRLIKPINDYVCLRLERHLHFLWIMAAAQSDSSHQEDVLSPALIRTKGWFIACTYHNVIIQESFWCVWLKEWSDLFFFPLCRAQWMLDGRRLSKTDAFPCGKLRGRLQNVFYWLFSINRKIFTDFWKLSREKKHF